MKCSAARSIPVALALRFARVKGYRPDKKASEADTIDAVRAFLPFELAGFHAPCGPQQEGNTKED